MERSSALPPNRSISLPSRLHPTSLRVEAELNKLRAWETRSSCCSSSSDTLSAETIQTGLAGLSEVYRGVEELVYSSLTQHGDLLEGALEYSVKLLDRCGIVRDMQQKMKEQAFCLQSSLRSRIRGSSSTDNLKCENEIRSYLRLRKTLKKETLKCIRSLKRSEKKFLHIPSTKDYHLAMVVKVLREVNMMTCIVLRSLLSFMSSPGTKFKKGGGCLLISKLRPTTDKAKKVMMDNEAGSVDDALFCVLHGTEEITVAHRKLEKLVISLDCIEKGLDVVLRRLIQYRVSFLNVLIR